MFAVIKKIYNLFAGGGGLITEYSQLAIQENVNPVC